MFSRFLFWSAISIFLSRPSLRNQQPPPQSQQQASEPAKQQAPASNAVVAATSAQPPIALNPTAKDITVDTPLYTAVINEQGGGFKSFVLKQYRNQMEKNSGPMQLILSKGPGNLPVLFSVDNGTGTSLPLFKGDKNGITLAQEAESAQLIMTASLADGLTIVRTLTFRGDSYLINVEYKVRECHR